MTAARCGLPMMPLNKEFCGRDNQGQDLFMFAKSVRPLLLELDIVSSVNTELCKISGSYVEIDGALVLQQWSSAGDNCASGFSIKKVVLNAALLELAVTVVVNEEYLTFLLSVEQCSVAAIPAGYYSAVIGKFAALLRSNDTSKTFELTVTPTSEMVIGCEITGAYRIVAGGVLFSITSRVACTEFAQFAAYVASNSVSLQIGARGQFSTAAQALRGPYKAPPSSVWGVLWRQQWQQLCHGDERVEHELNRDFDRR